MDVSYILDDLNDAQRDAVTADSTGTLVLAGAGSGKTRVLVHRIAWKIKVEGLSTYSILAVTFTNKAAREMRGRIEALLGGNLNHGMWVGTFHGLAHRLLKAHAREAGLPDNFQILDSDDQLRQLKRIHRELELDDARWPPRQSQYFINGHKDEGRRSAHIDDFGGDHHLSTMLKVYRRYEEVCQQQGVIDFAELLLRALELWRDNPAILDHYQQRFKHVLVDEFQDTNAVQYAWLRLLTSKGMAMTAVGDDDQSIYGWRGARIENIQQFSKDINNTQIVRLEQNYRSTGTILKAANALIANNSQRLGKELWTKGNDGDKIALFAAFNEQDEARFVTDRISDLLRDDYRRSDIGVLYRSNAQSRVLEEFLIRAGTPYRIYGGQRFYDRLEIKNALAYLRIVALRDDDTAIERVINTPTRGIGNRTVETLREYARQHQLSLWRSAIAIIENGLLPARAGNALRSFLSLIEELAAQCQDLTLDEQVSLTIDRSGLIPFHEKEKGEKAQARIENLQELITAARSYTPEDEDAEPLRAFLDQAALDAGDQQADEHEDSVQLMTLHSAKGLEFPAVFIVGTEENLFPHKMSMEDPERLEEERRLAYVGITRAEQKLYLSYAESRRLHGQESFNSLSRFVREIPNELIDEVRINNTVTRPSSYAQSTTNSQQAEAASIGFGLGQQVLHSIFGAGTVISFEGQGASARVQVNFEDEGNKWLVLQYANLQVL
ncbi:DNA helicase II [Zhongshania aliphaticivorans]|uniref:DNA 3'-5' helicase n=1 Tax=Zhongshania aliphaticivorans TaxID=1470434 RepID=A0A5S9PFT4_9GAMM|nr:DNA helicase II [Zhongshania aliphaticivorans]CAA0102835.1 DNA helicase II [Zhongshania aliphaticivorans]CAA0113871.1 DNA helicase II [Zhongshania aliphaticivorans]